MGPEFAEELAADWERAWNAHDVEHILSHYTDDVVFQSPYIARRFGEPSGEIRGKEALRQYFSAGLQLRPHLRFRTEGLRLSVDTLVINYRNEEGHSISEVLRFRDHLVYWGCGAYELGAALAATGSGVDVDESEATMSNDE